MPTVMTHALVGGALTSLRPDGVSAARVAGILALFSMLPDADVVAFGLGIPYGHALGHRGLTHGLPFAAAVSVAVPLLLGVRPGAAGFGRLWLLGFTATASHGVLDALTDGGRGVGFLVPFHMGRYFLPWQPLRVSPIGWDAFLRGRVGQILILELIWIVAPALAGAAIVTGWRRWRRRHGDGAEA